MRTYNRTKKNKGFSLIEMVVALGILVMVLSGAVTIIVSVVNLNLLSRNKTEAVAFAQDGVTIGTSTVSNGCFVYNPGAPEIAHKKFNGSNKYYRSIAYERGIFEEKTTANPDGTSVTANTFTPAPSGNFVRVTSTVQWNERNFYNDGSTPNSAASDYNSYQLVQVARNCDE